MGAQVERELNHRIRFGRGEGVVVVFAQVLTGDDQKLGGKHLENLYGALVDTAQQEAVVRPRRCRGGRWRSQGEKAQVQGHDRFFQALQRRYQRLALEVQGFDRGPVVLGREMGFAFEDAIDHRPIEDELHRGIESRKTRRVALMGRWLRAMMSR